MRLKVMRLKNGKLELAGIREIQEGDVILEGNTSMAEVSGEFNTELKESGLDDLDTRIQNADAAIKAEKAGTEGYRLAVEKKVAALKAETARINDANPHYRAEQLANLEASVRRAYPGWTDKAVQTFMKGRS